MIKARQGKINLIRTGLVSSTNSIKLFCESIETNAIECSFEGPDPLDKLTDELKKAQDNAIIKILNAYGLNAECVKQHPEKFTLQEMRMPGLTGRITIYKLSYNDKAIGEWKIHTSIDFDKNFVKSELSYRIL